MEIVLGKRAGFCYGVSEAVTKAEKVVTEDKNEKLYCLGELVHNKQVIEDLENKGIIFISNIDEIDEHNEADITNKTHTSKNLDKNVTDLVKDSKIKLIIRAHGIEKKVYEEAEDKNIEILDYTCPNVLAIHKIVEDYASKGYNILIMGEKKHPETIGTLSFTCRKRNCFRKRGRN